MTSHSMDLWFLNTSSPLKRMMDSWKRGWFEGWGRKVRDELEIHGCARTKCGMLRSSPVVQWVKDVMLSLLWLKSLLWVWSLLWHGFDPYPGTSACHRPGQKIILIISQLYFKKWWRPHFKRIQNWAWRGSHLPNLGQFEHQTNNSKILESTE